MSTTTHEETGAAAHLSKDDIRRSCFAGVPEERRALYWKILLEYLPEDSSSWDAALQRGRRQYRLFLEELAAAPASLSSASVGSPGVSPSTAAFEIRKPGAHLPLTVTEDDSTLSRYNSLLGTKETLTSPERKVDEALFKSEPVVFGGFHSTKARRSTLEDIDATPKPAIPIHTSETDASHPLAAGSDTAPAFSSTPTGAGSIGERAPAVLPRTDVVDDPLSDLNAGVNAGKWAEWQKDKELRIEIEKDIQRTLPDLHFFTIAENLAAMSRILFIYAKLNAGVRYVQGMNELLAPLWFVMAHENGPTTDMQAAEADTFFCFMGLMSEVRDVFITAHDNSPTGVRGLLGRFGTILRHREPHVSAYLASLNLDAQFYAFRWLTTLLSREFSMPDVLMLWDCFFADEKRFNFLLHTCVAMIRLQRTAILASDFGGCMKLLQNYPHVDIVKLIDTAICVRDEEESHVDAHPPKESPGSLGSKFFSSKR